MPERQYLPYVALCPIHGMVQRCATQSQLTETCCWSDSTTGRGAIAHRIPCPQRLQHFIKVAQ